MSNIVLVLVIHTYIKDKELLEKVQRRFTKMINNKIGKTYEERPHCLKYGRLKKELRIGKT